MGGQLSLQPVSHGNGGNGSETSRLLLRSHVPASRNPLTEQWMAKARQMRIFETSQISSDLRHGLM
ncbi:hypothetical protein B0I32_10727 [Nonomuraea fuscirosea]|uniref:Uncharacterized protein n=1 Tax=Nonomuraea fuscirosea TaxID=1291556 RepID=A0A2T0N0D6_9ACTN|nr:hypothetical protein B0I32_10727 [Nonomuraea fuscirosea]